MCCLFSFCFANEIDVLGIPFCSSSEYVIREMNNHDWYLSTKSKDLYNSDFVCFLKRNAQVFDLPCNMIDFVFYDNEFHKAILYYSNENIDKYIIELLKYFTDRGFVEQDRKFNFNENSFFFVLSTENYIITISSSYSEKEVFVDLYTSEYYYLEEAMSDVSYFKNRLKQKKRAKTEL